MRLPASHVSVKKITLGWIMLAAALAATAAAEAKIPRSPAAVAEFKRANPCPATGAHRGPCPGHQVDHIEPLCAGGPDTPENMQWLTISEHRDKTRFDVFLCRKKKEAE